MKKSFRLEGLCCANCAVKIEEQIGKLPAVNTASVNFLTTKLTIEADRELMDSIIPQAEKIVKKIEPDVHMVKA